jgi:hypothetical protein
MNFFKKLFSLYFNNHNVLNIVFYFVAACLIWYIYDLKILLILVLFVFGIASFSNLLIEFYKLKENGFKIISKFFLYHSIIFILILVLCLIYLDIQILGYIGVLSIIIALVRIVKK